MKKILLILFVLVGFFTNAQQKVNQSLGSPITMVNSRYGLRADSLQGLPQDTFCVAQQFRHLPWLAYKNGLLYTWSISQQKWVSAIRAAQDSSVTSITVINDSTLRVCYGNGTCTNISINTNITNANTVTFINDSTVSVCSIDTALETSVCDTIVIGRMPISYLFQNGIEFIGSNIAGLGGSLSRNTTILGDNHSLKLPYTNIYFGNDQSDGLFYWYGHKSLYLPTTGEGLYTPSIQAWTQPFVNMEIRTNYTNGSYINFNDSRTGTDTLSLPSSTNLISYFPSTRWKIQTAGKRLTVQNLVPNVTFGASSDTLTGIRFSPTTSGSGTVIGLDIAGKIINRSYGIGTNTGTLAYLSGYDANGNVIEVSPSSVGGGSSSSNQYITNLGNGDTLATNVNDSTIGIKTIKPGFGILVASTDTTLTIAVDTTTIGGAGGGFDGNNYPSSLSFLSDTLRLGRNGLSNLTANIPTFLNSDVRFDDATRNVWMDNRNFFFRDSAFNNYVNYKFEPDGATFDHISISADWTQYTQNIQRKNLINYSAFNTSSGHNAGFSLAPYQFELLVDGKIFRVDTSEIYLQAPQVRVNNLSGVGNSLVGANSNGVLQRLDTVDITGSRVLFYGKNFGITSGFADINDNNGVVLDVSSINTYTNNNSRFTTSASGLYSLTRYDAVDSSYLLIDGTNVDSAMAKLNIKAWRQGGFWKGFVVSADGIDFQNLSTDNTATQLLGKDANGHSVWRDVSSISGVGGSSLPSLSQYHFWQADGSGAPVDAGNITWNGTRLLLGTQSSSSTATPVVLSLGGTYGNQPSGNFANLKIKLYDDNGGSGSAFGFGVSSGVLEYQSAADHVFYAGSEKFRIKNNGTIQMATYVSGTIPTGTAAYNLAVDASGNVIGVTASGGTLPYKEYTALISQSGTSAPTVTVFDPNTIGAIVWTRSSAGVYIGTLTGAFGVSGVRAVVGWCQPASSYAAQISFRYLTDDTIELRTAEAGTLGDTLLNNNSLTIRVYTVIP